MDAWSVRPRRHEGAIIGARIDHRASSIELGMVLPHVPEWYGESLCAQVDHEIFFPEKGGSTRQAKALCLTCPVREQCLRYALDHDERFGIWGGLSERERRAMKKAEKEAAS